MGVVLRGWLASSCAKERSTRLAGGVNDQVTSAGHDDDDAVAWLVGEPGPHGVDVRAVRIAGRARPRADPGPPAPGRTRGLACAPL